MPHNWKYSTQIVESAAQMRDRIARRILGDKLIRLSQLRRKILEVKHKF